VNAIPVLPIPAPSRLRVFVPALALVAMIAVGLPGCSGEDPAPRSSVPPGAAPVAADAAAPVAEQIEQLMLSARTALNERRLLAPSGNNAIESYLAVIALESNHVGARQALLELIPPASEAVESAITAGELDEAQRRFDLFKQMGVSELRLNPLRARLTAARAAAERAAADEAAALAAANEADAANAATTPALAAEPPAAPATAPTTPVRAAADPPPPPATPADSAAPRTVAENPPATPPPQAVAAPEPVAAATVTPAQVAEVVEPRQIVDALPSYPAMARQRRLEGWVELEVAIGSDGAVGQVDVVRSEPAKVFDREAVRAAQRWRFEPRRENGVAVATRVRKTLTFRLTAG
jgi:protein TonB